MKHTIMSLTFMFAFSLNGISQSTITCQAPQPNSAALRGVPQGYKEQTYLRYCMFHWTAGIYLIVTRDGSGKHAGRRRILKE